MVCIIAVSVRDPNNDTVLIQGVLFRASYLGSTQLISEGQPSKSMRMLQAQEAVNRIKVICLECASYKVHVSTLIVSQVTINMPPVFQRITVITIQHSGRC